MKFVKLTMMFFVVVFLSMALMHSSGLAAEQPAVLLVTDHEGELPALKSLLEKNDYRVTLKPQKEIDAPITGYDAVFVYVHKVLLPKAETELVNYADGGGRLIVIHHGLASAKAHNPKWLELMGVKFYPRNDKRYPWCVTESTNFCVVNLMPEHYITSHKVKYDKTAKYTSQSRADLDGEFPAFDLPKTEVYHNMRSTDGNAKVILFGSKFQPAGVAAGRHEIVLL